MKNSYDDEFYVKLLNFLEQYLFLHWGSDTYEEYYWWVKDSDLLGRKGILTLKELVEDIFKYLRIE